MPLQEKKLCDYVYQESTIAYNLGDLDKSYKMAMRSKRLLSKAQNHAVDLAESNIQLVGVFRKEKKFGLAVQMIAEAHQVGSVLFNPINC